MLNQAPPSPLTPLLCPSTQWGTQCLPPPHPASLAAPNGERGWIDPVPREMMTFNPWSKNMQLELTKPAADAWQNTAEPSTHKMWLWLADT